MHMTKVYDTIHAVEYDGVGFIVHLQEHTKKSVPLLYQMYCLLAIFAGNIF